MFMTIMDSTIVNVILPTLARQFRVPVSAVGAVVVGYLLSLAVFIPASGWIGDRVGLRRAFLAALAVFTGASALCGLSGNLVTLVGFRFLQGVGGGMLTPIGMAMLYQTFPPYERIRASRILTIPTIVAPATGPVLGGLIVDRLSWHWVFYVNVPIGLGAMAFAGIFLRDTQRHESSRFDLAGFLLAGGGFALLMYALSEGPGAGWGRPAVFVPAVVGVAALAALGVHELRHTTPMLELRLLGRRLYRATSLVMMCSAASFLGSLYLAPLLLQNGLGLSALVSGSSVFPEALGVLAGAQIVSRVYGRVGPRRLITLGLLGVAAGIAPMTLIGDGTNPWVMRGLMFWVGLFNAHVFQPSQVAAFVAGGTSTTRISALFNTQRQLGAALGVAVLGTVLAAFGLSGHAAAPGAAHDLTPYHVAFLVAAVPALVGVLIALTIRDRDAASTMRPAGETT
jgi:EmrB/QacA subfamily drug resistance transporter